MSTTKLSMIICAKLFFVTACTSLVNPKPIEVLSTPQPYAPLETISHEPTDTPLQPNGNIILHNNEGIIEIDLENHSHKTLLSRGGDWLDWRVSFSQSGRYVVYWINKESSNEIWVSPLESWQPRLILAPDEIEFDVVGANWHSNDQYLLLHLGQFDEFGVTIDAVKSSFFTTANWQAHSLDDWSGDCSILAFSPRTDRLATWCSLATDQNHQQNYLVAEVNGENWLTQQPPKNVLVESLNASLSPPWAWSADGEFISFVKFDSGSERLYYSPTRGMEVVDLSDQTTTHYSFLTWSPNNQYVSYAGKCPDSGVFCHLIVDTVTQVILWTSQQIGNTNTGDLVWSPDSNFFAVEYEGDVVIISTITGYEVMRLPSLSPIELAWIMR